MTILAYLFYLYYLKKANQDTLFPSWHHSLLFITFTFNLRPVQKYYHQCPILKHFDMV